MSALAIEVHDVAFELDSFRPEIVSPEPRPAVTTHPRGRGFGVLSRMARSASDESEYVGRHRSDESVLTVV
jgi:hypothetical protein